MYCLFEKTENKQKRGRHWPIQKKDCSKVRNAAKTWFVSSKLDEQKRLRRNFLVLQTAMWIQENSFPIQIESLCGVHKMYPIHLN